MKYLTISPTSSGNTGYAVFDADNGQPKAVTHGCIQHRHETILKRIDATIIDLLDIAREYKPERVVLDLDDEADRLSFGAIWQEFRHRDNVGTNVYVPEEWRWADPCAMDYEEFIKKAQAVCPDYDHEADIVGSVSSAIMLGVWAFDHLISQETA